MNHIHKPFSKEMVEALNQSQNLPGFHPLTCPNDGDAPHIAHEFKKAHGDADYAEHLKKEKSAGTKYPEMAFSQTSLIATEQGWVCPVCDYKQNYSEGMDWLE